MRRPFFSIQPEAILWDVDDTLLDFTRCSQQALARACTRFSLPFDQTMYQTYRAVDDALWQAQRAGQCTVAFVMQTRFAHWFARLGIAADDRAFSQAYAQELACTHIREPYALETLAQLSKHIPLYAASNGIHAMQMQRLQRAGLDVYKRQHCRLDESVFGPRFLLLCGQKHAV